MWITATGHVGTSSATCYNQENTDYSCVGINLYRLLKGYVYLEDTIGPAVYFGDLTRWENVLHEILNALTTWIGDFLVVSAPVFGLFIAALLKTSQDLSMLYCVE